MAFRRRSRSLKFIEANGQPDDDVSLPIRSPEHAAAEAARDDVRVFLLFWDEYSIDQFASSIRAREALTKFVSTAFQPTDLVALMDQLTPTDAIRFTRDFKDLALDVKKLRGRMGVLVPTRSAVEDAQLMRGGDIRRLRAEVTLSALKSAVVFLGTLREGRKSVIFFSEGVRGLGSDAITVMSDVVRAANESNTAIYTVDPRGLTARGSSDSLYLLADNTGGRTIANTNGLDTALREIVHESSAFYLLGYSSIKNPADGKFHQIKSAGQSLGSRGARPARLLGAEREGGRGGQGGGRRRDAAGRRGDGPRGADARDVAPRAGPVDGARPRTTTDSRRSRWPGRRGLTERPSRDQAAVRAGGGHERRPGVAVRGNGRSSVGPTFPVAPGRREGGADGPRRGGTRHRYRDADRDGSAGWRARSLRGARPRCCAGARRSRCARSTAIRIRRRLPATNSPAPIGCSCASRSSATPRTRRLRAGSWAGKAASSRRSRSRRSPGRAGFYQIDLPLQSVAPGDYVIAIEARSGTERAETFVAIRVGRVEQSRELGSGIRDLGSGKPLRQRSRGLADPGPRIPDYAMP